MRTAKTVTCLCLWGLLSATAQADMLQSAMHAKCIDVPGADYRAGVELVMWECHGAENQQFEVNGGAIKANGLCLSALGAGGKRGDRIGLASCDGGAHQQWRMEGAILRGPNNLCADIEGGHRHNGARVLLWDCHGGKNQQWARVAGKSYWTTESYRSAEKSEDQLRNDFLNALKSDDYAGARAIAALHSSEEMRRAWNGLIALRRDGWEQVDPLFDKLVAGTSDYRIAKLAGDICFDGGLVKGTPAEGRSRKELDVRGMAFYEKALELYLKQTPFRQEVVLIPPLKGIFWTAQGPMTGRTHHSSFAGFHAYDMGYPRASGWETSMGGPVYAIADGVVVHADDQHPDNPLDVKLDANAKPNWVVIEHAGGIKSNYAHLQQHSARVKVGDRVKQGQQIGAIGNSGYTTGPHLHFTVERVVDRVAMPVKFTSLYRVSTEDGTIAPTDDLSAASATYVDKLGAKKANARIYDNADGGFFRTSGQGWEERDGAGRLKFHFREMGRQQGHVVLYDERRNVYVRFPARGGMAQYAMGSTSTEWRNIAVVLPR